jgi:hypothetical protein
VRGRAERVGDDPAVGEREGGDRRAVELADVDRALERRRRVEGRQAAKGLGVAVGGEANGGARA